jgi:hypothetical protein
MPTNLAGASGRHAGSASCSGVGIASVLISYSLGLRKLDFGGSGGVVFFPAGSWEKLINIKTVLGQVPE